MDLTSQIYDEVTNFGTTDFSESLLLVLKIYQKFITDVGRIGEIDGRVNTDGKNPRHRGGFKVLRHITINRSTRDVTHDGCMRSCYIEQNFDEGNTHLQHPMIHRILINVASQKWSIY